MTGLLITIPKASAELGINEKTLRKGVAESEVPSVKVGRLRFIPRWWLDQQANGQQSPRSADA